ncbi:hypothetical protein C8Q73DRAFT_1238 [Cubamyces lactineus]|nr:hypothetical protein C8Q73DRAFT_1238 [Cubamyces lactineus]
MDKPTPTLFESADPTADADVPLPAPRRQRSHQILRRKVSRAFSTLTRRSTAGSGFRSESDLSRTLTRTEPPLPPSRTATTTTTTSTSSTSMTAVAQRERERATDAASYTPAYPIVRLDPVLIGCFVCL